jgi:hypothetical protein
MKLDEEIAGLDLACVAYKVCRDEGWSLEEVDEAEAQYRAFLQVIRNAEPGFSAAPSRTIDIFWHHHILDTQKYIQDCEAILGRYIHHFPYSGVFGEADEALQKERRMETNRRLTQILD